MKSILNRQWDSNILWVVVVGLAVCLETVLIFQMKENYDQKKMLRQAEQQLAEKNYEQAMVSYSWILQGNADVQMAKTGLEAACLGYTEGKMQDEELAVAEGEALIRTLESCYGYAQSEQLQRKADEVRDLLKMQEQARQEQLFQEEKGIYEWEIMEHFGLLDEVKYQENIDYQQGTITLDETESHYLFYLSIGANYEGSCYGFAVIEMDKGSKKATVTSYYPGSQDRQNIEMEFDMTITGEVREAYQEYMDRECEEWMP